MWIKLSDGLAGFTAAEGCIFIHIRISNTCCTGFQVILYFQVTQHSRDEQLMRSFIEYLDCGNIKKSRETFNFIVTKLDDITQKILPFFIKYPILGVKSKDFSRLIQSCIYDERKTTFN